MKKIKFTKENIALTLILILSAILNFANIGIEGYANQYYAAGVKSMTMSLKNFFFVSFDPAGFVSIDKPPLGFCLQAISAKIFGYSGWSIILPQALAGVISVALIYIIVKRAFGKAAGLISALCLATTPVFVAVSRNNTIDNTLVMVLLFACLAITKAAEKGKTKYVILSLALVGVGFNIKMLQAYMVVPAIYLTYLLCSAVSIKKRIVQLVIATVVLVAVSLSWAVVVDLVPASSRPYVGSSSNNTVMELIFGHNGLERLTSTENSAGGGGGKMGGYRPSGGPGGDSQMGNPPSGDGQMGTPPNANNNTSNSTNNTNSNTNTNSNNTDNTNNTNNSNTDNQNGMPQPPQGSNNSGSNSSSQQGFQGGPGGIPGGNMGYGQGGPGGQGRQGGQSGTFGGTETASITRLFSYNSLSDQIIWLLPLAVIGFVAAAIKEKLRISLDNSKKQSLVLWAMWLLPVFIYFSYTKGLFHPYYLTMLAPPIAALTGIGLVSMWELYKEGGWKSWFLPAALAADGAVQLLILSYYTSVSNIPKAIMIELSILCFASAIGLCVLNFIKKENVKVKKALVITAVVGLLIAPTVWSFTTLFYASQGTFPSAGVELASTSGKGMGMPGASGTSSKSSGSSDINGTTSSGLIDYLIKNRTTEKYLVAVQSANGTASQIIIQTGQPVMTLGGFSGSDNILTLSEFKKLVSEGQLRYVIVSGGGQGGGQAGGFGTTSDQSTYANDNTASNSANTESTTTNTDSSKDSKTSGGPGGSSEIMNWVKANGKLVSSSEYSGSSSSSSTNKQGAMGMDGNVQLYDLQSAMSSSSSK